MLAEVVDSLDEKGLLIYHIGLRYRCIPPRKVDKAYPLSDRLPMNKQMPYENRPVFFRVRIRGFLLLPEAES